MIIRHDPPRDPKPYERSIKAFMKHVCWRKRGYAKKALAEDAMRKALADRPGQHLRVYNCPYCRQWHLTHKRERKQ